MAPSDALYGDDLRSLRERTLQSLTAAMSETNVAGAERCSARLLEFLPQQRISDNTVLVAYGGGKDSSYTLAFVRAMQLMAAIEHGDTFKMRVVSNRHAGMPRAVLENIDRAYRALCILEDPACEALLVDGDEIKPFRVDEPPSPRVTARNRADLLMTGHLTYAEARPTFCNACNLSMVNSFGLAAAYGDGVHAIITGDSPEEQRSYYLWVNRLARRFGQRVESPDSSGATSRGRRSGFRQFLEATDDIARTYFTDIYGTWDSERIAERRVAHDVPEELRFFSIYDDTRYSAGEHWHLLEDYLGFVFDEVAFSFTESDCGNPALMAHFRGLKCERRYGRSYADGLAEYVRFATSLMRSKEFPQRLIDTMSRRYENEEAVGRMRTLANAFAMDAYGLTEEQLISMVYAPFPGNGAHLAEYLQREQPQLAGHIDAIHAMLAAPGATPAEAPGKEPSDTERKLAAELERISGLELASLRTLYARPAAKVSTDPEGDGLTGAILAGDPHKDTIETRHSPDGEIVHELLSGR